MPTSSLLSTHPTQGARSAAESTESLAPQLHVVSLNNAPVPTAATRFSNGEPTPEWSSPLIDIPCPQCDYNLRGLTRPRCPECGSTFRWADVISSVQAQHNSQLFEYQWRRQPLRSFLRTSLGQFTPWRFWRVIPRNLPIRYGGLLLYLVLTCLFAIAGLTLSIFALCLPKFSDILGQQQWTQGLRECWTTAVEFPLVENTVSIITELVLPMLLLGGVAWLAMQIFRGTKRSHGISQDMVLRTVAYPFSSFILLWSGAYCILYRLVDRCKHCDRLEQAVTVLYFALILIMALVPFCVGMGFAWQRYLRVRRGWGLALLVSLILIATIARVSTYNKGYSTPLPFFRVDPSARWVLENLFTPFGLKPPCRVWSCFF